MNKESNPAPRLDLNLDVNFRKTYARQNDSGKLKNISLTGAFLETNDLQDISINEKLTVMFEVSGRMREVTSTIVWKTPNGCGIQFRPSNNRDVQIVDDLMYYVETKKDSKKIVLDSIFNQVA